MLAFGDVGNRAFMRYDFSVIIQNGTCIFEDHNFSPILAPQPILEILHNAICFQSGEYAFAINRINV